MPATTSEGRVSIGKLILIPALITLAITAIRLVGELQHWNPTLFNPAAGGGGALVGITWLVPIFGIYFAVRLCGAGAGPERVGRVFLFVLLAIIIMVAGIAIVSVMKLQPAVVGAVGAVSALVSILIMAKPWPPLFKTLLAYGYAARIPVAILMLFAIHGKWGTHYDAAPPGELSEMSWLAEWLRYGAIPQLIGWIAFTIIVGSLFGAITAALMKRSKTREHAATAS